MSGLALQPILLQLLACLFSSCQLNAHRDIYLLCAKTIFPAVCRELCFLILLYKPVCWSDLILSEHPRCTAGSLRYFCIRLLHKQCFGTHMCVAAPSTLLKYLAPVQHLKTAFGPEQRLLISFGSTSLYV